ncbi:MAG: LPXTG cell wall anchor domain-containing protein [Leptolinea sp.]|nr:LPXTG cell wall anchor domain-containing protein [Leptolinea sp.]
MSYPENQNQYEDFDEYESDDYSAGQQPKASNRTFFISFGLIAVIFALTLAALAFVVFYVLPQSREKREAANIQIYAANTATALAATQLSESLAMAAAATMEPTATLAPTYTPMVIDTPIPELEEIVIETTEPEPDGEAAEAVGGADMDGRTATLAALQTQAVSARLTAIAAGTDPSALPQTGIMDGMGFPGLAGLTAMLGMVIFAARKLRSSHQ